MTTLTKILIQIGEVFEANRVVLYKKESVTGFYLKKEEWNADGFCSIVDLQKFIVENAEARIKKNSLTYKNIFNYENIDNSTIILSSILENEIIKAILCVEFDEISHAFSKEDEETILVITKTIAPFILRAFDCYSVNKNINNEHSKNSTVEKVVINCISNLISTNSFDDAMIYVLSEIADYYNAEYCFILEINSCNLGSISYEWCFNKSYTYKDRIGEIAVNKLPYAFERLLNNEPIKVENIVNLKEQYPLEYSLLNICSSF